MRDRTGPLFISGTAWDWVREDQAEGLIARIALYVLKALIVIPLTIFTALMWAVHGVILLTKPAEPTPPAPPAPLMTPT